MEKIVGWWKEEKRYLLLIKTLLAALLPIVGCLVYCAVQGRSIGEVYLPGSEWNDELFYFKQVEAMVEFGYPQGYFGFNESHALKLSYAAWSPVLVFPWVIWGLIFGWNMLSPIICNILLMTLATALFVWLVKPTWKQFGILTLLFFLYTPFVRYMLSGMPEVICFSMLIIFYGLAVSFLRRETYGKIAWMLVISGLLTLMRPYMLVFMLLPMAFWIKKNKWQGIIGSVVVAGITGVTYVLIKHYLGAEYFAPLFFTDWVTAFFEQGLIGGTRYFFSKLYWNGLGFLQHINGGIKAGLASGAFFSGYVVMMLVLLWQSVADFLSLRSMRRSSNADAEVLGSAANHKAVAQRQSEQKERCNILIIEAHLAFCFVAMLFALLLMYKLTEGSKHLLTFMAAGVFVVSLMRTKFYKKAVLIGAVFAYFYSYMAIDPYDYQVPFVEEARQEQVQTWEETFSQNLRLIEENVPNYDNAVIWTFSDVVNGTNVNLKWQLLYGLPNGFGISCCMRDYILENFESLQNRYIATLSGGEIDGMCQEAGYVEIGRDADMVVYARY